MERELADMELVDWAQRGCVLLEMEIGLRSETTPDQLRFIFVKLREMLHATHGANRGFRGEARPGWKVRRTATTQQACAPSCVANPLSDQIWVQTHDPLAANSDK